MLDLIALVILVLFVLLGAWRGALLTGMSLLTLVAAYGAGILAATRFGSLTGEILHLPAFLGPPLAGTVAFVVTFLVLGSVARALGHWEKGRRGSEPRSHFDRAGGGLFGFLRGALLVVLLGWLGLWLDAARTLRAPSGAEPSAGQLAEGSAVGGVAQKLVEAGVETALSDAGAGGKLAARVLARPSQTLGGLQTIVEHPRIASLGEDQVFWTYVGHGALDAALNRASFYRVLHDAPLREELAAVGLVSEEAASDPAAFRSEARQVLARVGPRLRRAQEDPELQELAHDPEVGRLLREGNVLALLRHEGFQGVVSRALADGSEPVNFAPSDRFSR
jgi:uncharacterized membrane protein required for colicin V production